jgi:hypothetical protein
MRHSWILLLALLGPKEASAGERETELVLAACIGGRAIALVDLGDSRRLEPIETNHLRSLADMARTLKWNVVDASSEHPTTRKFDAPKVVETPHARPGEHVDHDKVILGSCSKEMEIYATIPITRAAAQASSKEAKAKLLGVVFDEVCPPKDKAEASDCPRGARTAEQTFAEFDAHIVDEETALHAVRFRLVGATGDAESRFLAIARAPEEGEPKLIERAGTFHPKASKAQHTTVKGVTWIEFEFVGPHRAAIVHTESKQQGGGDSSVVIYDLSPSGEIRTVDVPLTTD